MEREPLLSVPSVFTATPPPSEAAPYDSSRPRYLVGVDGGATKTLAAVVDERGTRLGIGRSGPSNREAAGVEVALSSLKTSIQDALREAQAQPEDVCCTTLAIAGVNTVQQQQWLYDQLAEYVSPSDLYVVNDVVAAWAAGTRGKPGIAIISGTGSHAFGVNTRGQYWSTSGWGHVLGDEGSGYWIGLMGMRAALRARDGSGPRTPLLDRVFTFFDVNSIHQLRRLVYQRGLTPDEIAAFASNVYESAQENDSVAARIFLRAGRELGVAVTAIVRRLKMQSAEFPVALTGGVFRSAPLLRESFEKRVRGTAPGARFVLPDMRPVGGSVLLAVRASGLWHRFDIERFQAALEAAIADQAG